MNEEDILKLLYATHSPSTPNFTDNNDFPDLPPSPGAHNMSPSPTPAQSRPLSPLLQPMDDSPSPNLPSIEPMTRKRPISPDSDGFTVVKNKNSRGSVKPKVSAAKPIIPSVSTSNSFAPLRSIKPPPIILPRALYDQSVVSTYIKNNAKILNYKIQSGRNEVKIFCDNQEEYDKIIAVFKNPSSNVTYYTYAKKGIKKNRKYLIMGLDLNHPLDSIKDALNHQHLIDVRRLTKTDKTGKKTQIEPILVTFSPEYNYDSHLKTIKHIDNVIIHHKQYMEENSIPQCHRCQRLGHTKNHCNMEHRCVRCSGNHPVTECQRETTPLQCANCGLEHPASYRGCEFRQKLLQSYNQRKADKLRPPPTYIPAPAPSHNAWGNPQNQTRLFPSSTNSPAYQPLTFPLPTPPAPSPVPPPPALIPQPIFDPNTPPRWVTDLISTLTTMFSTMMSSMNRLLDALTVPLTK